MSETNDVALLNQAFSRFSVHGNVTAPVQIEVHVKADAWNDTLPEELELEEEEDEYHRPHVYITCPFCEGKHSHGMSPFPSARVPHCGPPHTPSPQYIISLPTHFHFNPKKKCYEAARLWNQRHLEGSYDSDLDYAPEPEEEEARDEDSDDYDEYENIYSAAVLNKTAVLAEYSHSDERVRFQPAINNALVMVSSDGNLPMIEFLINNCEASKDHQSTSSETWKRTALMEAALWGHQDVVDYLLGLGADVSLVDSEGRTVSQLAEDTARNEQERLRRVPFYVEANCISKWTRNIIQKLIEARQSVILKKPRQNEMQLIQLSKLLATITDCGYKTGAVLLAEGYPREKYHPVMSVSGWSDRHRGNTTKDDKKMEMISNSRYTNHVLEFCTKFGITMDHDSDCDQGIPGRYYACHAEKQLIVYFMRNHFDLEEAAENSAPRRSLPQREMFIKVTQMPCNSCRVFAQRVMDLFPNVSIDMTA